MILSNVQSVARDQIRRLVAATVFGEESELPTAPTIAGKAALPLEDLVGVYSFGPGFEVSISTSGGRLLARANQNGYSELVSTDAEEWFSRMLNATVSFGRDQEGTIDRLIWGSGEGAPVGRKVR